MKELLDRVGSRIITLIDFFYFPFLHFIPREIFRYAVTGGANTLLDILLYFITYRYILQMHVVDLGIVAISPHIAAFLLVFPITFCTGFFLAKYVTFTNSEIKGRVQLVRYLLTVAGSILLNYIFLKLFVEYFHWYATFSKIVTTVIVVLYSYMAQRYFTFKTSNRLIPYRGN